MTTTDTARTGSGPALTEAVDPIAGTVRVRGHLTVQGADLLRGTVESLRRLGHACVLLDLAEVAATDDGALALLRAVQDDVAGRGGRVVRLHAG